jgi:hypothetical protein
MTRDGHINRGRKYRTERTGTETGCTETKISNHYFGHCLLKTKIRAIFVFDLVAAAGHFSELASQWHCRSAISLYLLAIYRS